MCAVIVLWVRTSKHTSREDTDVFACTNRRFYGAMCAKCLAANEFACSRWMWWWGEWGRYDVESAHQQRTSDKQSTTYERIVADTVIFRESIECGQRIDNQPDLEFDEYDDMFGLRRVVGHTAG